MNHPLNATVEHRPRLYFQLEEIDSESDSAYSSASETDIELLSSDTGSSAMGDLPRVTLKQMGGARMAQENQPLRYPELNENFELKSGLINLLPRFHGILMHEHH
ncbi:hypothetical protein PIB30_100518 [Stylosanthes scabra]|uniref:Uncharacterized protein n=1 Tax=Stylosanthes scabra TaxID=79078 RepID=A0ABU6QWI9_9FABA|nr:hypothetical protein [Stylosanthes scabra]